MMYIQICVLCIATNQCDSTNLSVQVTVLSIHTHGHNSQDVEVYQGHRCHRCCVPYSLTSRAGLVVGLQVSGTFGRENTVPLNDKPLST